jgi:phosphatidylglycerophosphatase C
VAGSVVAAFDFDGTITRRDSLLPFLRRLCGPRRVYAVLARNGVDVAAMATGRADRDAVKERVLAQLLAGTDAERAVAQGRRYATFLTERARFRPAVRAQLEAHRAAGHELVLVSASPALYLDPLGATLGFDAVLATELEVGPDGRLTGRLLGPNCRGPQKVARLEAWLGERHVHLYAYGDSAGDRELLARADVGCHVRRQALPAITGR